MTPYERCLAELARIATIHGHPAYLIAMAEADWRAEIWLIEREATA